MSATHLRGCDTRHTRRQRCNGSRAEEEHTSALTVWIENAAKSQHFFLRQPIPTPRWRIFGEVVVTNDRVSVVGGPNRTSIRTSDIVSFERTGDRSVNLRFHDRPLVGDRRISNKQWTTRDGQEADALVALVNKLESVKISE